SVVVAFFAFSDVVDGIMARLQGRSGGWGNFLDSTLDRLADGAIFAGLTIWFFTGGHDPAIGAAAVVCLVLGMVVSYARAKAESLGYQASVGIAERAERLASVLLIAGLTGLGLPPVVLFATLVLLAIASVVTIVQRMATVHRQAMAEVEGTGI
ncbi:phosphatidylinositol phosphate synthase, partial [Paenarthrobacter sp. RAF9]